MTQQQTALELAQQALTRVFEDDPALAELIGLRTAGPRWRYWTGASGRIYGWTTETADEGKYWAMEYRPVGRGARSGKATEWALTRKVGFKLRRAAKARALRWREQDA